MTSNTIAQLRFQNQQIQANDVKSIKELVRWMGAIQSQDYVMAKYAIGVRLKDSTNKTIEEAINKAEIIRTHVLRPTWHFVAAEDVKWMLQLTAKNLNRAMSSNNKRLELDEKIFKKANGIIEKLLQGGKHLTRKEIMDVLEKKGIKTNDLRASHIMFKAETDLIVCNGVKKEKQFTYALLDERVQSSKKLNREEALAELALRYFTSHGPATLKDFAWWSGLSLDDARIGLESAKSTLINDRHGEEIFWFKDVEIPQKTKSNSFVFLPAFDEFLISYKSRSISIDLQHTSYAFTNNGIFNPLIVQQAKVVGTWKPQYKKEILITPSFFKKPTAKQIHDCTRQAKAFGRFIEKEATLQETAI